MMKMMKMCLVHQNNNKKKNRKNILKNETGSDEENMWFCRECGEEWDENGDGQWIACDICSQTYHSQCSCVQYETSQYWSIQFDEAEFECKEYELALNQ